MRRVNWRCVTKDTFDASRAGVMHTSTRERARERERERQTDRQTDRQSR